MKLWTDGRTDGRTTEAAYTISSPGAFGSGELKTDWAKMGCSWRKNTLLKFQMTPTLSQLGHMVIATSGNKDLKYWDLSGLGHFLMYTSERDRVCKIARFTTTGLKSVLLC